jgi:hypothetical protein
MNIQDIIDRLSKEDIAKLNEIHSDFANAECYDDCEYYPEHVHDIINDAVSKSVNDWFDAIGMAFCDTYEGTAFRDTYECDTIEVILVKCGNGWLPSVRSEHHDAPASTIDSELALADPKEAMAWGITDALTQHIFEEGILLP